MKRNVMYKNASAEVVEELPSRNIAKIKISSKRPLKKPRPQSSSQDRQRNSNVKTDSLPEYHKIASNYFTSSTPSQVLYFENFSQFKAKIKEKLEISRKGQTIPQIRCDSNKRYSLMPKNIENKRIKLLITGRPLTASSLYKDKQENANIRPQSYVKKRDSIFSYGDSEDFSPLDPKFYDEEITHLDEYTQLLLSQPIEPSENDKKVIKLTKKLEPEEVKAQKIEVPRINENIKNSGPALFFSIRPCAEIPAAKVKPKGKLYRGRCHKSWIPSVGKTIQNLKLS